MLGENNRKNAPRDPNALAASCRYIGRGSGAYVLVDAALKGITGHFAEARQETVAALALIGGTEVLAGCIDVASHLGELSVAGAGRAAK